LRLPLQGLDEVIASCGTGGWDEQIKQPDELVLSLTVE
jgi:hypothetical protein